MARRWWWIAGATLLTVAVGMGYSLGWGPIVRHHPYWLTSGDFWGTWRNAHWVGWNGLAYVYGAGTGLVTLPGYAVLLSPLAILSSALHLTEAGPVIGLPKPEAWLLAGPFVLATSGVTLAACDALAAHLGASAARRKILLLLMAGALWPATAMWGHPEDVLALGFAAYALVRVLQRRYTAAGWLLGLAIAMQLYVVVLVPIFLAVVGLRRVGPMLARASVAPGFLFVAVVARDWRHSLHALWAQPNYPTVDHATPWAALSPSLGHNVIAAGPARIVAFALAAALGAVAVRYRTRPVTIVWLCALALAGRCIFEAVMVPYYVMPVVAIALVGASVASRRHLALAALSGAFVTVDTFWHYGPWPYWLVMTGATLVLLAAAAPTRRLRLGAETPVRSLFDPVRQQHEALLALTSAVGKVAARN
jgi:hypothetical protein